jgi:hypothetical protein
VRSGAKAAGFGWALWAYDGDFGLLVEDAAGGLDQSMARALGLRAAPR